MTHGTPLSERVRSTTRRLVVLACVCSALTLAPHTALAHPIHTTLSVATLGAADVTFSIRVFADDFSSSVARYAGKRAPADSSAPDADVLRYLRARFVVRDVAGQLLALESCGTRRANDLYWLCVRVLAPHGVHGVRLTNQMLTELHADQVNIVQLERPGARRTMLFTKGSEAAVIA